MVLDLLQQLVPWGLLLAILFFLWLILTNKKRLHKIRYSGRVSEIIDRRRNILFFSFVIALLLIGLVVDLYLY